MSLTDEQLAAVKHRSERFLARLSGDQEGSTPLAAQLSAVDVPDLLAEVGRLSLAHTTVSVALDESGRYGRWAETELERLRGELADALNQAIYWKGRWEFQCNLRDEDLMAGLKQDARIKDLETQRDKVLKLHTEDEGRCTECVTWAADPDDTAHGDGEGGSSNVEWPCPTAAIYAESTPDTVSQSSGHQDVRVAPANSDQLEVPTGGVVLPLKMCPDCKRVAMLIEEATIAYRCPACGGFDEVHADDETPDANACPACSGSLDAHSPDCVASRLGAEVAAMPVPTPEESDAALADIERRVAADKDVVNAAQRSAAAYRASTARPLRNDKIQAISEELTNARSALLAAVDGHNALDTIVHCGHCNGTRWVDDQNWQPEDYERTRGRVAGSGRIPCGGCNEAGWSVPDGQTESPHPFVEMPASSIGSCQQCSRPESYRTHTPAPSADLAVASRGLADGEQDDELVAENAQLRIGTPVCYWPGLREGAGIPSTTRTPVWRVAHGAMVVSVDGKSGGILLTHVERRDLPCCGMHNRHCEPPAELCCHKCTEVDHPRHPEGVACTWLRTPSLDEAIARWVNDATLPLHEYLGMAWDQWLHWFKTGELPEHSPFKTAPADGTARDA